jgi:hypothetical protein
MDSVVPLFEREQALTITPLPLGTSAARSFARVGAARRAREGKRRSVSPRAREPRGAIDRQLSVLFQIHCCRDRLTHHQGVGDDPSPARLYSRTPTLGDLSSRNP